MKSTLLQILVFSVFLITSTGLQGQTWVDSAFQIKDSLDIHYGTAVDFAGNNRTLLLDISYPVSAQATSCGRPLIILVHGGAFMAGDKSESSIKRLRKEFAQRGYVAVAVNYRLGLFQTSSPINCNVSNFGVEWNCLNMADTAEWYRAYYRAVQDVKGSLRFMINRSSNFEINPDAVFICGESAGGFIAMGASYIDDSSEVLQSLIGQLPAVSAPNSIYEADCIQGYGLDSSISSMRLDRPALGSFEGQLNLPLLQPYRIRGCGNIFGAVFNPIFDSFSQNPSLYLFHQPNDLIVPFQKAQIFSGFAYCATQFPFSCQYIVNRPLVYGSSAIRDLIQNMSGNKPHFQTDFSNNTANCAQQIANPSLSGHAYDNFTLRSKNMALFFSRLIDSCNSNALQELNSSPLRVFPNPVSKNQTLTIAASFQEHDKIKIFNTEGRLLYQYILNAATGQVELPLADCHLQVGYFLLQIEQTRSRQFHPLLILD